MEWKVGRQTLVFSLIPRSAPFFFHDGRPPGNPDATADINVLRKYLENARLQEIEKPFDERIITFRFIKRQIWGEEATVQFVVHAGRVPTAWYILDATGTVLWSRNDRTAVAGTRFQPEPDDRLPLDALTPDIVRQATEPRDLFTRYRGLGPAWSRELMMTPDPAGLLAVLAAAAPSGGYRYPKEDFPLVMVSLGDPEARFDSLSDAVADRLIRDTERQRFQQRKRAILKQLAHRIDRKQNLLHALKKEHRDCDKADRYLKRAELLSANFTRLKRGMTSVTLAALDTGQPVTVPLDPNLHPQEMIGRLYRKAARLKRKRPLVEERIQVVTAELQALLDERYAMEQASEWSDLPETAPDDRRTGRRKADSAEAGIRRLDLADGFFLYVGRNSRGNQVLVNRKLGPHDLWFHAKDIPGSHVVLKNPGGKAIPEHHIETAARIAAWCSSAGSDSRVEVQYTDKKNLYSSKGKGLGFVLLRRFQTRLVTPLNPDQL